jgi:hypothetical protein
MNDFLDGFIKGVKGDTPAYFAPIIALWRHFATTTESLLAPDTRDRDA